MRILVTGGAGYVGSHVVRALLEVGSEPLVYDNLSTGHAASVGEARLVVGDVQDRERLASLLRANPCDGCIHLAASSLVGESVRNPSKYFRNNVGGGLSLFDSLVETGVPWVVLSSTAAVYGAPKEIPIPEHHAKAPTSPYGESKEMLERVLSWYESAYGLRHAALRYFNAAGAHPSAGIGEDHTPETHLIPLILQTALGQRERVSIFGSDYDTPDGTAIRDYVHVCDLAAAHLDAMRLLHTGSQSGTFNLGTERGYSVREVIETTRQVTGRRIPVEVGERRAGDPTVLVASSLSARSSLEWVPRFDLNAIIETAWRWHVTHPKGFGEGISL